MPLAFVSLAMFLYYSLINAPFAYYYTIVMKRKIE